MVYSGSRRRICSPPRKFTPCDIAITELGAEEIPLLPVASRWCARWILFHGHQAQPDVPLAVTTNIIGLEKRASALAEAGLTRINVSLDTICREAFAG